MSQNAAIIIGLFIKKLRNRVVYSEYNLTLFFLGIVMIQTYWWAGSLCVYYTN